MKTKIFALTCLFCVTMSTQAQDHQLVIINNSTIPLIAVSGSYSTGVKKFFFNDPVQPKGSVVVNFNNEHRECIFDLTVVLLSGKNFRKKLNVCTASYWNIQ